MPAAPAALRGCGFGFAFGLGGILVTNGKAERFRHTTGCETILGLPRGSQHKKFTKYTTAASLSLVPAMRQGIPKILQHIAHVCKRTCFGLIIHTAQEDSATSISYFLTKHQTLLWLRARYVSLIYTTLFHVKSAVYTCISNSPAHY